MRYFAVDVIVAVVARLELHCSSRIYLVYLVILPLFVFIQIFALVFFLIELNRELNFIEKIIIIELYILKSLKIIRKFMELTAINNNRVYRNIENFFSIQRVFIIIVICGKILKRYRTTSRNS